MKIYEHRGETGELISFEVRNVGRSRMCRIVEKLLPSTTVLAQRADEFATFDLNGKTFIVEEPFGDNSRYLVYEQPPQSSAELEMLKNAFAGHSASRLFSGDKSFRIILGVLAFIMFCIVAAIATLTR